MEVKVDGNTIDIVKLREPLRLRVGEHGLLVGEGDFETVTESFTVKRGKTATLRVTLKPKPIAAGSPASIPVVAKELLPAPPAAAGRLP